MGVEGNCQRRDDDRNEKMRPLGTNLGIFTKGLKLKGLLVGAMVVEAVT